MNWLELYVDGDTHPRRFDSFETAALHLKRIERLSDEALQVLREEGTVAPPLSQRILHLRKS